MRGRAGGGEPGGRGGGGGSAGGGGTRGGRGGAPHHHPLTLNCPFSSTFIHKNYKGFLNLKRITSILSL